MEVIAHIGARIAQARRERGLTHDQLAAVTHFSVSLVRHVEQGTKPASHAFTTAAARELGVQLRRLLGQEQVHRQHQEDDSTVAPALRAAMDAYDDPQLPGAVRSLPDLESTFASAERLWLLGIHRDTVQSRAFLRTPAARAHPAGRTGFTYGLCYQQEVAEAQRVEREFPDLWCRLSRPKLRRWMRRPRPGRQSAH